MGEARFLPPGKVQFESVCIKERRYPGTAGDSGAGRDDQQQSGGLRRRRASGHELSYWPSIWLEFPHWLRAGYASVLRGKHFSRSFSKKATTSEAAGSITMTDEGAGRGSRL